MLAFHLPLTILNVNVETVFGGLIQVILFLLGLSVVVMVLIQGGKAFGLGNVLSGSRDSNLFSTTKSSFQEKRIVRVTFTLSIIFIGLMFITFILYSLKLITFL